MIIRSERRFSFTNIIVHLTLNIILFLPPEKMEKYRVNKNTVGLITSYPAVHTKANGESSKALVKRAISNNYNYNSSSSLNNNNNKHLSTASAGALTSFSLKSPKDKAKNYVSTQSNGYGSYSSVFSSASYGSIYSKVNCNRK